MTTAAILLAGGAGSRMRGMGNKVFVQVGGRPLLMWSVEVFTTSPAIDHVVLVTRDGERERVSDVLAAHGTGHVHLTTGGATRQASEQAGLSALADLDTPPIDTVLIHDTARPFARPSLVERIAATARSVGGAVPVLALGTGVYRSMDTGRLAPESNDLYRAQTPQGFRARPLVHAYRRAADEGFVGVDTVETVQRYTSITIAAVPGERDNIKVTYEADLATADAIAGRRRPSAGRQVRGGGGGDR